MVKDRIAEDTEQEGERLSPVAPPLEIEEDQRKHCDIIAEKSPNGKLSVLFERDFDSTYWTKSSSGANHRRHTLSWGDNLAICTTGIRGAGKSKYLAWLIADALIKGFTVLSNMPVAFLLKRKNGSVEICETHPLKMEELLSLSDKINRAVIVIDEIGNWLGNRQWNTVRNRLLNAAINQMRKQHLDMLMSCKNSQKLDAQFREDELDVEIHCQDYHDFNSTIPKGRTNKLQFWDKSGVWTGIPWYPGKWPPDAQCLLKGAERLNNIYDSYQVQDYWESMTRFEFEVPTATMSKDGVVVKVESPVMTPDEIRTKLIGMFEKKARWSPSEFWATVGIDYNTDKSNVTTLYDVMGQLGVVKTKGGYTRDYSLVNS